MPEYIERSQTANEQISSKLTAAVGKFETNYKETLNEANLDQNTINTLYDLGADIKHLMDEVIDILDEE